MNILLLSIILVTGFIKPGISCSPPCSQDEICTNTASGWTCLCNTSLYYTDPSLTTKFDCGLKMSIYVIKCQAVTLGYNTSSMHLIDPTCRGVESILGGQRIVSIEFNQSALDCGTTSEVGTSVVYKNTMHIDPTVSTVIIASPQDVTFTCNYPLNVQVNLDTVLTPTLTNGSDSNTIVVSGSASFTVQMLLFSDASFQNQYAPGASIVLRVGTPVYVSVRSPDANDLIFDLVITDCFANPSPYGNGTPSFHFIENSCPVPGIPGLKVIANGLSLESRFQLNVFQFVTSPAVYLFCSIHFCDQRSNTCSPTCGKSEEKSSSKDGIVKSGLIQLVEIPAAAAATDFPFFWKTFSLLVALILSVK